MYYIRNVGQIDVRKILSVGAWEDKVAIHLEDGSEIIVEADFDEVMEDIRVSQAIENASSYQEMLSNVHRIWEEYAGG